MSGSPRLRAIYESELKNECGSRSTINNYEKADGADIINPSYLIQFCHLLVAESSEEAATSERWATTTVRAPDTSPVEEENVGKWLLTPTAKT